jgi:ribosomal protein L9
MKKNNNKVSKNKIKRAKKNKKRLSNKIQLSSFERKQERIYGSIMNESAVRMASQKNIEG